MLLRVTEVGKKYSKEKTAITFGEECITKHPLGYIYAFTPSIPRRLLWPQLDVIALKYVNVIIPIFAGGSKTLFICNSWGMFTIIVGKYQTKVQNSLSIHVIPTIRKLSKLYKFEIFSV